MLVHRKMCDDVQGMKAAHLSKKLRCRSREAKRRVLQLRTGGGRLVVGRRVSGRAQYKTHGGKLSLEISARKNSEISI